MGGIVALQGRAPGWTLRLAPRGVSFIAIRLVGIRSQKEERAHLSPPAGPYRALAGAEGVPFLRGSSDRSSFSDRNFLLGRRPPRHQQDPYGALLGREMCPFFLLASNGRRDLDIRCRDLVGHRNTIESAPPYGEPATWLLLVMGGLLRSLVEDGDVAIPSSGQT